MLWKPYVPVVVGILQFIPAAASAQVALHGRVLADSTSEPIAGAKVVLLDSRFREVGLVSSDSAGSFMFDASPKGVYRVRVERTGYTAATTPMLRMQTFHLAEGDSLGIEVRLLPHAVLLAPLTVHARPQGNARLEGFFRRMANGFGVYLTQADIAKRNPSRISDLLVTIPGVRSTPSADRTGSTISMGRALAGGDGSCPAQIFVDGHLINRRRQPASRTSRSGNGALLPVESVPEPNLDDLVHTADVFGVEIYHGLAGVPAEFYNPDSRCGVVAIWTRTNS